MHLFLASSSQSHKATTSINSLTQTLYWLTIKDKTQKRERERERKRYPMPIAYNNDL